MLIIMIMLCFVLLQSAQCGYLQNKHEKIFSEIVSSVNLKKFRPNYQLFRQQAVTF